MSRRPPSQRNSEYRAHLLARYVQAMLPGAAGGRLSSASPVPISSDAAAQIVPDSTGTDAPSFTHDAFVLTAITGDLDLTFLPLDGSAHVYLNGIAQLEGTDYTLDAQVLTVEAAMDALVGDVLEVRYAYTTDLETDPDDITVVTNSLPMAQAGWKYLAVAHDDTVYATDGVEGDTAWADPDFDDTAWSTGMSPMGWKGSGGAGFTPRNTTLPTLTEVFMRYELTGGGENWEVTLLLDNWAFFYFNGERLSVAGYMTANGAFNASDADIGGGISGALKGPFEIDQSLVRDDKNVLAIHVQDSAGGGGYGPGDVMIASVAASWTDT